jgi:hypothetical protein
MPATKAAVRTTKPERVATADETPDTTEILAGHGLTRLPRVRIESYNLDVKHRGEILNNRLRRATFAETVTRLAADAGLPIGGKPGAPATRKRVSALLEARDETSMAVVAEAVDVFANEMAFVISRFLERKPWDGVQRIAIGGGFSEGPAGERCVERAQELLHAGGRRISLAPIHHGADDAGLIGGAHLLPTWMLRGHDGMVCVDLGGTNLRVGLVALKLRASPDLAAARVVSSEVWLHADDDPHRTGTVEEMIGMIRHQLDKARRKRMALAPVIAIGCPGVIDTSGTILRGAMNLPGGNWESERFNLARAVARGLGDINGEAPVVLMHNDAVIQGLSQWPWMRDAERWGILTIGTGLGNACYSNLRA